MFEALTYYTFTQYSVVTNNINNPKKINSNLHEIRIWIDMRILSVYQIIILSKRNIINYPLNQLSYSK